MSTIEKYSGLLQLATSLSHSSFISYNGRGSSQPSTFNAKLSTISTPSTHLGTTERRCASYFKSCLDNFTSLGSTTNMSMPKSSVSMRQKYINWHHDGHFRQSRLKGGVPGWMLLLCIVRQERLLRKPHESSRSGNITRPSAFFPSGKSDT